MSCHPGSPEGGDAVTGNGLIFGEDGESVAHCLGDQQAVKAITTDEGNLGVRRDFLTFLGEKVGRGFRAGAG